MASTADYDDAIRDLLQADHEIDEHGLYHWLTIQDVQLAADILEPLYQESDRQDGYVSLELSPLLAYDADATIDAARHLWQQVDRPNLMIKVPGTVPGLLALERLIAEGINVNVTLLFSALRYRAVADAFLRGLSANPDPTGVASVASFFISRIDTKVDKALETQGSPQALALRGQVAVASAKQAYRYFTKVTDSPQFEAQRQRGARPQRLLWASTSTKNPAYCDVLYVNGLIGPDTVSTVTPDTLDAFVARGVLGATLERDLEQAEKTLAQLEACRINLPLLTDELEREGVEKFVASYRGILETLRTQRTTVAEAYASTR
jgi:transaldolase